MEPVPPNTPAENEPDFYAVIGVSPDTAPDELRRAYGEAAKGAMSDRPRFEAVAAAFEILKDPAKRAAYDRRRKLSAASVSPEPKREPPQMDNPQTPPAGATLLGGVTMAMPQATQMPPANSGTNSGDRTQAFVLPTVCALNLSPCPLLAGTIPPDEGFCAECGVLVGTPIGDAPAQSLLPKLTDADGREFPLKSGANVVGREGADVMLPDKTVSRRHAVLTVAGGNVLLEDMGSTNGTKKAGQPLLAGKAVPLADQMSVQFGSVKLTIFIPFDPSAPPLLSLPSPNESAQNALPLRALSAPSGANANAAARLIAADGTAHPLTSAKTTFGRKPTNNVVVSGDSFVSGSHAEVWYESERYRLVDVGSTNGTKLNGRKLVANEPQLLTDGDEIVLGQTPFTFRVPGAG